LLNHRKQKIYVADHKGMVGSAIAWDLGRKGYTNLVYSTRDKLDLTDQTTIKHFF